MEENVVHLKQDLKGFSDRTKHHPCIILTVTAVLCEWGVIQVEGVCIDLEFKSF